MTSVTRLPNVGHMVSPVCLPPVALLRFRHTLYSTDLGVCRALQIPQENPKLLAETIHAILDNTSQYSILPKISTAKL